MRKTTSIRRTLLRSGTRLLLLGKRQAKVIILAFCATGVSGAGAIVIEYEGRVTDGWLSYPRYDAQGRYLGQYYTDSWSSTVFYTGQPCPCPSFSVLSQPDSWTLAGTANVDSVYVDSLTISGGSLTSSGTNLRTLSMTGGSISGNNLAVTGSATIQGALLSMSSFQALSANISNSTLTMSNFHALSADISNSTLSAMALTSTDRLVLNRTSVGGPSNREGLLSGTTVALTDSTVHTSRVSVGESLQMQGSTIEAADGLFWTASPISFELRASTLSAPGSYLSLYSGTTGTSPLGMDANSSLVTAQTMLWSDYTDATLKTTFTHSGGNHTTSQLYVPKRTAYVLTKPTDAASVPTLNAVDIFVGGELNMQGGTLKAGGFVLEPGATFLQKAGNSTIGSWNVGGIARISGTAQVVSTYTKVSDGLVIEQLANVNAGQLGVSGGNVLLDRPGDSAANPALRTTSAQIEGGFHHDNGYHASDNVSVFSGASDISSGWYWLKGGTLLADTMSVGGHFDQSAGESKISGNLMVFAAHTPLEPNVLLSGGKLEADRLTAWAPYEGWQSPLIRQKGGTASFRELALEGSRFELKITTPLPGQDHLTVTDSLRIRGAGNQAGSFEHSAGRLVTKGHMETDWGGSYVLSGTGVLDGSQSNEPFEVLGGPLTVGGRGGNFLQTGGEIVKVRGLSVDGIGTARFEAGKASFREWVAVSGDLQISGKAVVDIGGSEYGLQIGAPYVEGENEDATPGAGLGKLTLALDKAGLLTSSRVGVGTFESGLVEHTSGRHWVAGALTIGSTRVLTDAWYVLGPEAELRADTIVLTNKLARSDDDRARVSLKQGLGEGRGLAFRKFTSLNSTHHVHASAPDQNWVIGDFVDRDGVRYAASYEAKGSTLQVESNLRLIDRSKMLIAPSGQFRGWAEVQGSLALKDGASLKVTDDSAPANTDPRPTLLVRGGLSVESSPANSSIPAMEVFKASVHVLGQNLPSGRATVAVGAPGSQDVSHLLLSGPSAHMQISGPQKTQLLIGPGGAGQVGVTNKALLEIRAAQLGSARPEITGDWRPVVIGKTGDQGTSGLAVDWSSKLIVEGRGNQITVASGVASLEGTFNAVVVGKPVSPVLTGGTISSTGTLSFHKGSVVEVTFDGFAPKAGDYIPLASAQSITYGAGSKVGLTPYKLVSVGGTAGLEGSSGYEFSLGMDNVVFRVATPTAGLYPALERVRIGSTQTETLGIRFVDQAVLLNFAEEIEGAYVNRDGDWRYDPSSPTLMLGAKLRQSDLVTALGQALWGTPASADGHGEGSLGQQLLLPYFVADSRTDSSLSLANVVDVRFSQENLQTDKGRLAGNAPRTLNSSGIFPDIGNKQKDGQVHVFSANEAMSIDKLVHTVLHETGHSLGLLHTYKSGTDNVMDYDPQNTDLTFANTPLTWTERPQPGGTSLLLTQNPMLHLLKYSFGWSDAELQAFGADYGSADFSWTDALNSLLVKVKTGISFLGDQQNFTHLEVLTPSLTAEGATLWEPLLTLESASAADIEQLLFTGLRGLPFRILAGVEGRENEEIRFIADADGNSGTFAEGVAVGRLVQVNLDTGMQIDLGSYTLAQTAAVPEPSTGAMVIIGILIVCRVSRTRQLHRRGLAI